MKSSANASGLLSMSTAVKHLSLGLIPATVLLAILLIAKESLAAKQEFEILCRAKAKETAADVYRGCIEDHRNSQLDDLKRDYQDRLRAMKEEYERELSQIAGKPVAMGDADSSLEPERSAEIKNPKKNSKAAAKNSAKNTGKSAKALKGGKNSKSNSSSASVLGGKSKGLKLPPAAPMETGRSSQPPSPEYFENMEASGAIIEDGTDESVMDIPEPIPVEY